jgi:hypothetical protein
MYKLTLVGEQTKHKLINLCNINTIDLYKNELVVKFNTSTPNGFMIIGSGGIDSKLVEERFHFPTEEAAQQQFDAIEKASWAKCG